MTPISIVIITFNEEHNIANCIESIKSIADDILVVDSFSTDNTVSIATKLGARVVSNKFVGHIEQKNFAITQAFYPHILSLDADELSDERLIKEIYKVKANWNADGYYFNRLNNYCGKWIRHGAWYPDRKLRLWDSRKGSWKGLNPHDKFEMIGNSKAIYLEGNLLHFSYKTTKEHISKAKYFSSIASESYFKKNKRSNWIKIILNPISRFIRDYIFKKGFLDGLVGMKIALISALEVFLKYKKLLYLQRNN
jgi:glycosyltransferase involved in cell wall biosynthesis